MPVQAAPLHDLDRASLVPTSAMSEAALIYGYSRTAADRIVITMPCVCGGEITTPSRALEHVQLAIDAHSDSTGHQQWRARQGIA